MIKLLTLDNLFSDIHSFENFEDFVDFFAVVKNFYFKKISSNNFLYGTLEDFLNENKDWDIEGRLWIVDKFSVRVFFGNLTFNEEDCPNHTFSCHNFEDFFKLLIENLIDD